MGYLASFLAIVYLRFVNLTSRVVWVGREIRERLEKAEKGIIYAFWHQRQAFLTVLHAGDRLHPLISRSKDGDIIARVCVHFGLHPARGSSSRGGTEAMLDLIRYVNAGDRVSVTPDGPKGPARQVQSGVLYLAQKTGAPIVPVATGAKRRWDFNSWDRFQVFKPFNRISMVYGEPILIKEGDNLEHVGEILRQALDEVTQKADDTVGHRP
jgi:lysophospholipid acyltransferase (LPLAT)-like uncharacterized protein